LTPAAGRRYTGGVVKADPPGDEALAARARRITRVVFGTYIVLLSAFVVSNIVQVVRVLYFGPESDRSARAVQAEPCRHELTTLADGLERATADAASARDATSADLAYHEKRAALSPAFLSAARACASETNGPEALAAMTRLDRAAEATARRRGEALAPVRREVDSFIR
jgi:hypothetical protein